MKLEGVMAELMTKTGSNKYHTYVNMENGKPVLYMSLDKALYGTLQAALLFWKKPVITTKKNGFLKSIHMNLVSQIKQ